MEILLVPYGDDDYCLINNQGELLYQPTKGMAFSILKSPTTDFIKPVDVISYKITKNTQGIHPLTSANEKTRENFRQWYLANVNTIEWD